MDLKATASHAEKFLRDNSPAILTGFGVTGVVSTAYLAHQAGYSSAMNFIVYPEETSQKDRIKSDVKAHWKRYIPMVLSGAGTITCIVLATKISNRRTAVITAAYSVSERAFSEYKEKIKEKLGEKKEQGIRDEIAADKIRDSESRQQVVILGGEGDPLCCELHTMRYFHSNMETLRKAANDVNALILRQDYAYLHDFYHFAKIPQTSADYDFGWTSDRLMELEFTSTLFKGQPCLAFEYNYYKPL